MPLTGPQAHYGEEYKNGVTLAIEDANAEKPTIDGKPVKFELVAEDDLADPKAATQIAQKFVDAKVNGIIGHFNSGTAIPASKIYSDAGIPQVAMATAPAYTQQGFKTTFRSMTSDTQQGTVMGKFVVEVLKAKKIAIIDDRTAYGQGLADVFKKEAEKLGVKIVATEFTNDKATDFMAILTSIKAKKPEAIFYGGMYGQAGPMLRQMAQLGMGEVKMFGGDGMCVPELAKVAAGAKPLDHVVCADGGSSLAKMPGGTEWKKRYDAKFPGQFQVYSPYFYDATMLLADAMKRANSWDPKVYIPFLQKTDYQGVTSKIAFEPNGEMKNPTYTLSRFVGGNKTAIE